MGNPDGIDISDEDLLRRAVEHPPRESGVPHWVRVRMVFGVGSGYATKLCQRFGCDPDAVEFECPSCGFWHAGSEELREFCSQQCADDWEEMMKC